MSGGEIIGKSGDQLEESPTGQIDPRGREGEEEADGRSKQGDDPPQGDAVDEGGPVVGLGQQFPENRQTEAALPHQAGLKDREERVEDEEHQRGGNNDDDGGDQRLPQK